MRGKILVGLISLIGALMSGIVIKMWMTTDGVNASLVFLTIIALFIDFQIWYGWRSRFIQNYWNGNS